MERFFTYILASEADGRLYIGSTNNLEDRLNRHNNGRNKYTKKYLPWTLLYAEEFSTRAEAMALERKLKSWKNPSKVREYIHSKT